MNFEVHEKEIKQYKKLIILGEIIPIILKRDMNC